MSDKGATPEQILNRFAATGAKTLGSGRTWKVTRSGEQYTVVTPNRYEFDVDAAFTFPVEFDFQEQSSALWVYSLAWLPYLHSAGMPSEEIHDILNGLLQDFDDNRAQYLQDLYSINHLVAEALESLVVVWAMASGSKVDEKLLHDLAIKFYGIADASHRGHATNQSLALLISASRAHEQFDLGIDVNELAEQLVTVIDALVGNVGFVDNSFHYSYFVAELLTVILDEQEWNRTFQKISRDVREAQEKILRLCALAQVPDNEFLPLGDVFASDFPKLPSSTDSIVFSPDSGLLLLRSGNSAVSFRCGARTHTHKQLDDNSVTVTYDGVPLIVDAGFKDYSTDNPESLFYRSQLAHSGPYYQDFDAEMPWSHYASQKRNIDGKLSLIEQSTDHVEAQGTSILPGGRRIERRLVVSESSITFDDEFSELTQGAPVCRFLISGHLAVARDGKIVRISDAGVPLAELEFEGDFTVQLNTAVACDAFPSVVPSKRIGTGEATPVWVVTGAATSTRARTTLRLLRKPLQIPAHRI